MDCAALVRRAAAHFVEADDAAFLECFHEAVTVYAEPALAGRAVVTSRAQLEDWIAGARNGHPGLDVTISDCKTLGIGAVCDAIVVGGEAPADVWRVTLAVRAEAGEIAEVRAFWAREAATEWLVKFQ
jgi:hypothetical protein